MKLKNIIIILVAIFLVSCESNEINIDENNLLLGSWVNPIYEGEKTSFTRNSELPKENYGITFNQNGSLIERTSGWCGTPPLSFFNVEGSFTLNDNLISISKQSYPTFYGWRILELTENKLVVKRELSEQEKDHRALMDLFNEISNLAYGTSCSDSSDWTFTAYGAKACGGPQGFIPYNKNIDIVPFLQKVEAYTNAEKEFNIKWSIASDCAIINSPKGVDCKNNYPVLIY